MRVGLLLCGLVLWVGCLEVWWASPVLTSGYTADFTSEFFARAPAFRGLVWQGTAGLDAGGMVWWLELGLLLMTLGYLGGVLILQQPAEIQRAAEAQGRLTDSGIGLARVVFGFALLCRLTLVLLPGLYSTDVFSYVMYGRIAAVYGQNPYARPPSDFPNDPFLGWVFPFWRGTPSVYGPAWTDMSWFLSTLTGGLSAFDQVVAYRLWLALVELLTLGLLWWLLGLNRADGWQRRRIAAFALFAWNPLVLFDLVGSSHNDVAMLCLLLLGLLPIIRSACGFRATWLTGIAAIALSALVKYLTGVAALLWATAWVALARSPRERVVRLLGSLGVGVVLAVVLWWPWLQASGAFTPLGDAAGGRLALNSAPDLVALTVADQILQPAGMDGETARIVARWWTRAITRGVFVAYLGWELHRVWQAARLGQERLFQVTLAASTRALLVLPLLVLTWVWSWYLCCSLALAALQAGRSRSDLVRLVVGYTLIAPPVVYAHQYLNQDLSGGWVLVFALGPLAVLLAWRRLRASVG